MQTVTVSCRWLSRLLPALVLSLASSTSSNQGSQRLISRRGPIAQAAVSEAPEGRSDSNWVVQNIVDGRWSEPPFYPNQAWMARHLGEQGFDIWCRLDLGRTRRVHRLRLQNSQLPSFVHPKDLSIEFSNGERERVTMAQRNDIQEFHFPVHETSFVKIHLLSHYGDGFSIDKDSGGFSEVEVYEVAEEDASKRHERPFAVGRQGHITTWLVLPSPNTPWPLERRPVDGEIQLEGTKARSWTLTCFPTTTFTSGKGDLLFARLQNRTRLHTRLYVHGAQLLKPAGGSQLVLAPGVNDVFLRAEGGPVTVRLVPRGNVGPVGFCRVMLSHERGGQWEQEVLSSLCKPRLGNRVVRPGARLSVSHTKEPIGCPVPATKLTTRLRILPGGSPLAFPGLVGETRAPDREGRFVLQGRLDGTQLSWSLPFVVNRQGFPRMGFTDVDGDGRPDVLRATWHGKDCLWISDDKSMTRRDVMGRFHGSYAVLVDVDGDGVHDGPRDFIYQAVDLNHDGVVDYEIYNASEVEKLVFSFQRDKPFEKDGHFKLSFLDWDHFGYANEQEYTGWANYRMGVHGNGCFHNTRRAWGDTRLAWENPIAWYDLNNDGYSDMVVRCADFTPPKGLLQEFETAFDIDRDSGAGRECTYNLQITRTAYGKGALPYMSHRERYRPLEGLRAANYLFVDNPDWRANPTKIWIPYFDAYRLGTDCDAWESCWLLFDEDFEDKRWEEMFSVHESWEPFADHLGDRWEMDSDYSGKGQLYIGRFDGRMHLFGAEKGEWTADYHGLFHGSVDRRAGTPERPLPPPGLKHNKVRYMDTDGNGFFDRIEYCLSAGPNWETGDRSNAKDTLVKTVSLLDYATTDNPHPDVCQLLSTKSTDPITGRKVSHWRGEPVRVRCDVFDRLTKLFAETTEKSWEEAFQLYRAAESKGLTLSRDMPEMPAGVTADLPLAERTKLSDVTVGPGYAQLLRPVLLRDRYRNAYWLKEKVMSDVLAAYPERADELKRLYYTGRVSQLVDAILNAK